MNTKMMDIPGINLHGVYEAADLLSRANADPNSRLEDMPKPLEVGRRVVVIDRGDLAFDCLYAALQLGSEDITCLCDCSENEKVTQNAAREKGVKYRFLTQPVKFIAGADGRLAAVECVELKLSEPDKHGYRKPVPVEGSNFSVAADTAIISNVTSDPEAAVEDKTYTRDESLNKK